MAALTLITAIESAEMLNQSTWKRVWASELVPAMSKGFYLGSLLVFLLVIFFGIMGVIAYAKHPIMYNFYLPVSYRFLAFFNILIPLGWEQDIHLYLLSLSLSLYLT